MYRNQSTSRPSGAGGIGLNKKKYLMRLRVELVTAALISLVVAFGISQLTYYIGVAWVDKRASSKTYLEEKSQQMIDFLQDYIDESDLKSTDTRRLTAWQKYEKISFSLYDAENREITYFYSFSNEQPLKIAVSDEDYEITRKNADAVGVVTFADGVSRNVQMMYDKVYQMYNVAYVGGLLIAVVCYLVIFFAFINRKIHYIKQLAEELRILEGGDLKYEITIRGGDELSELAEGINNMRKAVLFLEQEERKNVRLNRDLITALSHDVRTPMTSLIGYLEILFMHKDNLPEQELNYLESARSKAFQLKEMTDTLFEYSLVSGKTEETYELEKISIIDLLVSIEDTQMADLLSSGWQIEKHFCGDGMDYYIEVDMDFYCRVLDNLVSNIRKYADKSKPLVFTAGIKDHCFRLSVSNTVLQGETLEGSTGVGLKTCQKIVLDMKGSFKTEREGEMFTATIIHPLVELDRVER